MAVWAEEFIDPQAWIVDDTGYSKDGAHSPGVAWMYCGALGKTGNCQIGVFVHAGTDWASAAVSWRLFLPESWDDTKSGRDRLSTILTARRLRRSWSSATRVANQRRETARRARVSVAAEDALPLLPPVAWHNRDDPGAGQLAWLTRSNAVYA